MAYGQVNKITLKEFFVV